MLIEHLGYADARQGGSRGAEPPAQRRRGSLAGVSGPAVHPAGGLSGLAPLAPHCIAARRQGGDPRVVGQGALAGVCRRRVSADTHMQSAVLFHCGSSVDHTPHVVGCYDTKLTP